MRQMFLFVVQIRQYYQKRTGKVLFTTRSGSNGMSRNSKNYALDWSRYLHQFWSWTGPKAFNEKNGYDLGIHNNGFDVGQTAVNYFLFVLGGAQCYYCDYSGPDAQTVINYSCESHRNEKLKI